MSRPDPLHQLELTLPADTTPEEFRLQLDAARLRWDVLGHGREWPVARVFRPLVPHARRERRALSRGAPAALLLLYERLAEMCQGDERMRGAVEAAVGRLWQRHHDVLNQYGLNDAGDGDAPWDCTRNILGDFERRGTLEGAHEPAVPSVPRIWVPRWLVSPELAQWHWVGTKDTSRWHGYILDAVDEAPTAPTVERTKSGPSKDEELMRDAVVSIVQWGVLKPVRKEVSLTVQLARTASPIRARHVGEYEGLLLADESYLDSGRAFWQCESTPVPGCPRPWDADRVAVRLPAVLSPQAHAAHRRDRASLDLGPKSATRERRGKKSSDSTRPEESTRGLPTTWAPESRGANARVAWLVENVRRSLQRLDSEGLRKTLLQVYVTKLEQAIESEPKCDTLSKSELAGLRNRCVALGRKVVREALESTALVVKEADSKTAESARSHRKTIAIAARRLPSGNRPTG
jgi:hypothetical protein